MPVSRINRKNFDQILGGKIDGEHEVVIKLYGSNCHLCHALKPEFVDISDEYEECHLLCIQHGRWRRIRKKVGL